MKNILLGDVVHEAVQKPDSESAGVTKCTRYFETKNTKKWDVGGDNPVGAWSQRRANCLECLSGREFEHTP